MPPYAVLGAAVVAAVALVLTRWRDGFGARARDAGALWLPLHLLLVATGGLGSPLLPVVAAWLVLFSLRSTLRRTIELGAAAFALLVLAELWTGGLGLRSAIEAVLVVGSGLAGAWIVTRLRMEHASSVVALDRILGEAASGREGSEPVEAARRLRELESVVDRVRLRHGALRAVLWDVDAEGTRAWSRVVCGGHAPASVTLHGDPLRWAWSEGMAMHVDSPASWAVGAHIAVLPLDADGGRRCLLTLDFDAGAAAPDADALQETAAYLQALLNMQRREAAAVASRIRFLEVLELIRRLPREIEPAAFAAELAESARRLGGGTGAAVAVWEQDVGRIIAAVGDDGGPAPGVEFGPLESEMSLAARGGAHIVRESRSGLWADLPVAAPGERWLATPRALAALPLVDGNGDAANVIGVLAIWSSDRSALDPESLAVVEALCPFAALQLRHARSFGSLRDAGDRDPLTSLYSRRAFEDRLNAECVHFRRYRRTVSLLFIDIDHLSEINDTLGHDAGDAVLRAVGHVLKASVREADFAARFGGEEFIILCPETPLEEACRVAERLRLAIERMTIPWKGRTLQVRASIGVSSCPECVPEPIALVRSADQMLYASKTGGRNRVTAAPTSVD
mgnify:FL=1